MPAETAFELAVLIETVDRFTTPMKGIMSSMATAEGRMKTMQRAMRNMGSSSVEIDRITSSMKKLNDMQQFDKLANDLDKIGMSKTEIAAVSQSFMDMADRADRIEKIGNVTDKFSKIALAGAGMTAVGVGMAMGLTDAVKQAGALLTVMTTIKDATGATNGQMKAIQDSIKTTSSVTRYGILDTANIAQTLATSGLTPGQVNQLLPQFTKFAEVQQYGKGIAPGESVPMAIELAHGFGQYSPKQLDSFLNTFNKASFMQPEDSKTFAETLKYTMTTAQGLGMSNNDIMFTAALANRMGLAGSMGGTNAADMIMRMVPGLIGGMTPKINKKTGEVHYPRALQAMMDLGMADARGNSPFFKNGRIVDLQGLITGLYERTKGMDPEQKLKDFKDIFGIQGMRFADLIASQRGQEQLQALVQGQKRIKSTDQMQQDYLNTPEGQMNALRSNLQNLKYNVFLTMAQDLNPFIHNLNSAVVAIQKFSDQHPKLAKYLATFALMATGALLIAGPLTSLIGLVGMLGGGMMRLGQAKSILKMVGEFKLLGRNAGAIIGEYGRFSGVLEIAGRGVKIFGSFIGRITGLTKIWRAAQWALNLVLDANPIALIIIGIAALIAGIVLLVRHWKTVIRWLKEAWTWFTHLGFSVQLSLALMMPIIGFPALIIAHWKQIETFFRHLGSAAEKWGMNIVHGLWNGIKSFGGWLGNKITSFVSDHITGPFKHILGIHSPSTVFMQHGKYIVQGLALGITGNGSIAARAVAGLAGHVNSSAQTAMVNRAGSGTTIIQVYPHKHQRAEDIANMVLKKMGKPTQRVALRTGARLNPSAR